MNQELEHFKIFAMDFAEKAGAIMKQNFTLGMTKEWKSDVTPVTETDFKINRLLIEEVKNKFPDHQVKGEEESNLFGSGKYVWVCDPVDGTIPFSHGIPISTFSLALVYDGQPIIGVVCDPFQNRLYFATKGEGATLNGNIIQVSKGTELKGMAGSYEMFKVEKFDIRKMQEHLSLIEDVKLMKLCSIVYPSALVAAGEFGFTIFPHNTAHDGAAIKILVEEAGGKVTDLYGEDQRWDTEITGFIASNGYVHDRLVELSKEMITKSK